MLNYYHHVRKKNKQKQNKNKATHDYHVALLGTHKKKMSSLCDCVPNNASSQQCVEYIVNILSYILQYKQMVLYIQHILNVYKEYG